MFLFFVFKDLREGEAKVFTIFQDPLNKCSEPYQIQIIVSSNNNF